MSKILFPSPTKYRLISNGYTNFLQYEEIKIINFFFFKKIKKIWKNIPTDYYHHIYGRGRIIGYYDDYICEYNTNIESFIKRYPNVSIWLKECHETITKKKREVKERDDKINALKGKTKILN